MEEASAPCRGGPRYPLSGLRMGILGKGGSGKSTFTVLLARELKRRGYQVCILDADSTNVGIHRALGAMEVPRPLVEHFGGMAFQGGSVTCPVDDPTPLTDPIVPLHDPSSPYLANPDEGVFLLVGGKMGDMGVGGGCDGPIAKIARDLEPGGAEGPLVTLVDLKAGMEDSSRGVLTTLDLALIVVDPTTASIHMAGDLRRMVEGIRSNAPPATLHLEDPRLAEQARRQYAKARIRGVLAILNRIPDTNTEVRLSGKVVKEAGLRPIGALRDDPTIGSAWLEGSVLISAQNQSRLRTVAEKIEEAVTS